MPLAVLLVLLPTSVAEILQITLCLALNYQKQTKNSKFAITIIVNMILNRSPALKFDISATVPCENK